ncbi:MAG: transcription termination/antitermination protein NusG [Candidatus Delongbacteria bacterium]|nr:transcription termination/antitermination protein NusG [Candidatus Delongbacteria bacterium]MDD4204740.1 transcription termination/antitermination protein NusG [Candidatus Delongbacteria bacterium]MDY0016342.1 transcription termination/antitermination protein NusG [Candidatus Delongbacteria bacterium]
MSANWYILHVLTGEEVKTKEFLESEIDRLGYKNEIAEIFVPSEEVVQMRNGKKVKKIRLFYPGYLFINCHLSKTVEHFLMSNSKVLNFVGPKNSPQELSKKEVERMLEKAKASIGKEKVENIYKVGDFVKIVDGPFTDFSGIISEINEEKQRLKVMVTIFGRSTPVDLDFLQVKYE